MCWNGVLILWVCVSRKGVKVNTEQSFGISCDYIIQIYRQMSQVHHSVCSKSPLWPPQPYCVLYAGVYCNGLAYLKSAFYFFCNILGIWNVSLQAKVTLNFRFEKCKLFNLKQDTNNEKKNNKMLPLFLLFTFYSLNYSVSTSVVSCEFCQITYHSLVCLVIGCSMETLNLISSTTQEKWQ